MIASLKKLTDDEKVDKRQTRYIIGSTCFCGLRCDKFCGTKDGTKGDQYEDQDEFWFNG